jgi:hypothetical protein
MAAGIWPDIHGFSLHPRLSSSRDSVRRSRSRSLSREFQLRRITNISSTFHVEMIVDELNLWVFRFESHPGGMVIDPKSEALALHRFGFGPRVGLIAAIAADLRGALLADIDRPGAGKLPSAC